MYEKRNKNKLEKEMKMKRLAEQAKNPKKALLSSNYQIAPLDYQKLIQSMAGDVQKAEAKEMKTLSENKIVNNLEVLTPGVQLSKSQ